MTREEERMHWLIVLIAALSVGVGLGLLLNGI